MAVGKRLPVACFLGFVCGKWDVCPAYTQSSRSSTRAWKTIKLTCLGLVERIIVS